jgi:RNA polymerase sigma-70 factor (ECF subfamily)
MGSTTLDANEELRGAADNAVAFVSPRPRRRRLDPDSEKWIRLLTSEGGEREDACRRLHVILLKIARAEIGRRHRRHNVTGPELDDLAHQAASDALLSITRKIEDFRGDSKFTTWAFAFVVFEVSNKLGRHFWRNPGVTMDAESWERLPDRFGLDPVAQSLSRELLDALHCAVDEVLTAHQRRIFVALVLNGVPLDALVERLGTSRSAIYKAMYDARRKLRERLVSQGYLDANSSRQS